MPLRGSPAAVRVATSSSSTDASVPRPEGPARTTVRCGPGRALFSPRPQRRTVSRTVVQSRVPSLSVAISRAV